MYIKIPVAYLIISYKSWCGWWSNCSPRLCRNLTWRKTIMNFEEKKKQYIKKWLKIPTCRQKIWSRNRKINYDAVETSSKNLTRWVEKVRRNRRRTLWPIETVPKYKLLMKSMGYTTLQFRSVIRELRWVRVRTKLMTHWRYLCRM